MMLSDLQISKRKKSVHADNHFTAFALARVKNDRTFPRRLSRRGAAAMRVTLETEFARAKAPPQQQTGGQCNYRQ
jgi:hypothetical protein